jgi:O-antigen ligase
MSIKNLMEKFLSNKLELLFILLFFLYFLLFPISNYTTLILELKAILTILIFSIFLLLLKKIKIANFLKLSSEDLLTLIFFIYLTLSIIWSNNPNFGIIKLLHFILQFLPFYIFFKSINSEIINKKHLIVLLNLLNITAISIAIYIIIYNPFIFENYQIIYRKFSHVYPARIISFALIINLLVFYKKELNRIFNISFLLFLIILGFALSLTAHRTSIFAVIFCSLLIFLINIKDQSLKNKFILMPFILFFGISLILSKNFSNRTFEQSLNRIIIEDATISSRLNSIKISWEIWNQNKIFGAGIGGFYSPISKKELGPNILYPHNLFFELLCETGLIGLILFVILFTKSLKFIINNDYKKELIILWFYFFINSITSKDITINFPVFIFFYFNFLFDRKLN